MEIDTSRPDNDRITSLKVRCSNCIEITYDDLDDNKVYNVTTIGYLADGGDGYDFLVSETVKIVKGPLITDLLRKYLEFRSPVIQEIEGRIKIVSGDGKCKEPNKVFKKFRDLMNKFWTVFNINWSIKK